MTIPTAILKIIFVIASSGFGMLVGAWLGATIFGDHGGHGMAGIANMLFGAGVGAVTGAVLAFILIFKFQLSRNALKICAIASSFGALSTFLLIQVLDSYDMW